MRNFTEETLSQEFLKRLEAAPPGRLREIVRSLVPHLYAFVQETKLTEAEWFEGIRFLTATGQMCDDLRQEFILLSDTLGVSTMVDITNHRKAAGATETTVIGPFYRDGAPELKQGDSIAGQTPGESAFCSGRVTDPRGRPIAGALLDIWQAAPNGLYDNQDPTQPTLNLRGKLRTDAQGAYAFRTVKPASYPIPMDGPVGQMMRALGRHPYRPAHVHFIVSAEGYVPLTTHLFVKGDAHLDTDAVFQVKDSLVVDFVRHDSADEAARRGAVAPFYTMQYDFGLQPA